jgi:hypothetical protein
MMIVTVLLVVVVVMVEGVGGVQLCEALLEDMGQLIQKPRHSA